MQQDTLPLVAYAYVALIHESIHAGLLMHACMLVSAPALACVLCPFKNFLAQ
jgi:hypothetical protein